MLETELCAYTLQSCRAAAGAGVTRVELCSSPYEGGCTPSAAAIEMARRVAGVQLFVMMRPRGGDFLYSDAEFDQMLADVSFARQCGADGVVAGMLRADGRVDVMRTAALVAAAQGMEVTFHRAFDMARDLGEALEAVIEAGCHRVLTAGGCNKADEGIEMLRALVERSARRIKIMAGSGVNAANVRRLAATGVDAIHFSARMMRPSGMSWRNPAVSMGGVAGIDEYASVDADPAIIKAITSQLKKDV